ncbi:hypothetical protein [Streptomyces sodiiphilus]|uniref:hypothetical protein n=1 Tax=Streptomyces sodiiphilus TaxID=226217 RepID=UPI0031DF6895
MALHQPDVVPKMPSALANLHNRRRAGIQPAEGRAGHLRIMAWLVLPVPNGLPRMSKSVTTLRLAEECGHQQLCDLAARPGVSLGPAFDKPGRPAVEPATPQSKEKLQHAVYFPHEDIETPVVAFVLFRLMPTLRFVGWSAPHT